MFIYSNRYWKYWFFVTILSLILTHCLTWGAFIPLIYVFLTFAPFCLFLLINEWKIIRYLEQNYLNFHNKHTSRWSPMRLYASTCDLEKLNDEEVNLYVFAYKNLLKLVVLSFLMFAIIPISLILIKY